MLSNLLRVSEIPKPHVMIHQAVFSLSDFQLFHVREYILKNNICIEHTDLNGCDYKITSPSSYATPGSVHLSQE